MGQRTHGNRRIQKLARPQKRRIKFTRVNWLIHIPLVALGGASLATYLGVTMYRHRDAFHWSVGMFIIALTVLVIREQMKKGS